MDPDILKQWLINKKSRGVTTHWTLGFLSLFGGILVTAITFAFTYYMTWLVASGFASVMELVSGKHHELGQVGCLIISSIFMALLFMRSIKRASDDLSLFQRQEFEIDARAKANFGDHVPFIEILSRPRASSNFIAEAMCIGPRLVVGIWPHLVEASRLGRLDETGCAQILALLFSRTDDVSYEELCAAGWGNRLSQLKQVDGVYFLKRGMLLSEELRAELTEVAS